MNEDNYLHLIPPCFKQKCEVCEYKDECENYRSEVTSSSSYTLNTETGEVSHT